MRKENRIIKTLLWLVLLGLVVGLIFMPRAKPTPPPPHDFSRSFNYFTDPNTKLCFVTVTETEQWSSAQEGMGGRTSRTTTNVPCDQKVVLEYSHTKE